MTRNKEHDWDIVKVCIPKQLCDYNRMEIYVRHGVEVLYEREEKYKYTQQEKDIIKGALAMGFKYIGRDSNDALWVFSEKPNTRKIVGGDGYIWYTIEGRSLFILQELLTNIKPATKEGKELVVLENLLKEIEEQD